jgi:hypothetical protein
LEARTPLLGKVYRNLAESARIEENPEKFRQNGRKPQDPAMSSSTPRDGFDGRERRQHRMYVTRNTEYHFRGPTCVAVRDRKTGRFLQSHLAVQRTLSGGVKYQSNGTAIPSCAPPQVGEALYFGEDGRELVTSLCSSIERPERCLVAAYPNG